MQEKTFLWIEDRKGKASYTFWKCLLEQLFPAIQIESKKNNSELVKAVKNLEDRDSKYLIVFDNSFDNFQTLMELKLLKTYADKKENVRLMDVICFEYLLLEFDELIDWIYAPEDDFREKRIYAIAAREKLVASITSGNLNYKSIKELIEYDRHIEEHNIEQLAARLLFDLTRNTGFEVSKGRIGECWIRSCCEWKDRGEDDICGLEMNHLSIYDKMKRVYEKTCLKNQFHAAGLEA